MRAKNVPYAPDRTDLSTGGGRMVAGGQGPKKQGVARVSGFGGARAREADCGAERIYLFKLPQRPQFISRCLPMVLWRWAAWTADLRAKNVPCSMPPAEGVMGSLVRRHDNRLAAFIARPVRSTGRCNDRKAGAGPLPRLSCLSVTYSRREGRAAWCQARVPAAPAAPARRVRTPAL